MGKIIPNYRDKSVLPSHQSVHNTLYRDQHGNSSPCNLLAGICVFTGVLFLELSKTTLVKTVVEEIDERGKVLSSRVHSIEEKTSKMTSGKTEQKAPF